MGLDMSLYKARKYIGVTIKDITAIDSFFWYNEKTGISYKDFCEKCEIEPVDDEVFEFYNKLRENREKEVRLGQREEPLLDDIGIIDEVACWRKVNCVHKWFVDNIQDGIDDCAIHRDVTRKDIIKLRDICNEVLADNSKASKLLPSQDGFFFGPTDYNEWYFNDIKNTVDKLNEILNETDFDNEVLYYKSSW